MKPFLQKNCKIDVKKDNSAVKILRMIKKYYLCTRFTCYN